MKTTTKLSLKNLFSKKYASLCFIALSIFLFSHFTPCSAQNPTLYGITSTGGQYSDGNIFKFNPSPASFADKVNFVQNSGPEYGHMIKATDGNLYGMTPYGGANIKGNIFEYNPITNTYTDLVDFTGATGAYPGTYPYGSLVQANDGNLYGMTVGGGVGTIGNIFRYNPTTHVFTDLVDFTGQVGPYFGQNPWGSLIQATDGNLYGMTSLGGVAGDGNIFKYNITTSTFTDLIDFTYRTAPNIGRTPKGSLVQGTDGKLYGTTESGGTAFSTFGNLFSYDPTTSTFANLVNFTGNTGAYVGFDPFGTLIQATDGNLYGMTLQGGPASAPYGNIFRYNPTTTAYADLVDFTDQTGLYPGGTPFGSLLQASDGKIYGMTEQGGANNDGNIFQYNITTSTYVDMVDFTTFYTANPYPGVNPYGDLVEYNSCSLTTTASATSNVLCNGGNTGIATANPSSGTSPYTYSWSNGTSAVSTNSPTGAILTAGSYTVTVTDAIGCTATAGVTITAPASALGITMSAHTNISCYGQTGSATANAASGGTSPYSYSWSPSGGTNLTASSLSAGSYTITATDANSCTATASVTITAPASSVGITILTQSNVQCFSGKGSATANAASGGVSPYGYNWTPSGGTNLTASNLSAGIYTITATDANSCTATASVTITAPASLVGITIASQTNATCGGLGSATANAASGGTHPYNYSWTPNGGTNLTASNLSAGTYTITASDAHSCTATASVTINQTSSVSTTASIIANVGCLEATTGNASASPSGGTSPYTYSWSNGGTDVVSTNNPTGPILSAGSYTVTVSDSNGCMATASVTITQPATGTRDSIKSITNVKCNGGATGVATIGVKGGTTPYTYQWSNGGTNISNTGLSAGIYTVTITNHGGCSNTLSVTITQPPALSETITLNTNLTCYKSTNGSATSNPVGGTSPYTYAWTGGSTLPQAVTLAAGTDKCTVTDSHGCTATANVVVTQPNVLTVASTSVTEVRCNGTSTGAATVSGLGGTSPYSYSWNGGPSTTNATMSGLSAGIYSVTVTDINGCSGTHTVMLTQPSPMRDSIVTSKTVNVKCLGVNYGTAQVGASYGTTPYTYLWSNSLTTANVTTLSAGTYTISVTDNCGASGSATVTITAPAAALAQTTTVNKNVTCFGGNDGGATSNPSGGTTPYTYLWNTGETNQTITDFISGNHLSTLKDAHGCSVITPTIITQPAVISASFTTTKSCFGSSTGTAIATGKGGSGNYISYIWSNSDAGSSISALSAGTYSVTITDNNSCSGTASVTVAAYTQLVTTIPGVTCTGSGGLGKLTVSSTGGTPAYKYLWSTGATTTTITVVNGSYTAVCTDKNLCTASAITSFNACPEIKPKNDDGDGTSVENNVSVYPNPNSGQFTIAGLENGMIVEMYDYTGRKITTVSASDMTMQLNISTQANGIYLIRILDKDGNLVGQKKVVKTN